MGKSFAEEARGDAGVEQQRVSKEQEGLVITFRDAVELLDVSRRNSVKNLVGGKKFIPLRCAAPWCLSFAMHGLLAGRCLLAASELASTIGLNVTDFVAVHLEIFDCLLHREGSLVLSCLLTLYTAVMSFEILFPFGLRVFEPG